MWLFLYQYLVREIESQWWVHLDKAHDLWSRVENSEQTEVL